MSLCKLPRSIARCAEDTQLGHPAAPCQAISYNIMKACHEGLGRLCDLGLEEVRFRFDFEGTKVLFS